MFKRCGWILLAMIPSGALLGVLAAAAVNHVMPRKYGSTAVLRISPRPDSPPLDMAAEAAMAGRSDSLEKVADALSLTSRWNLPRHEALEVLRKSLAITHGEADKRISIRAEHTYAEDARDIVEETARSYVSARNMERKRAKEQAIGMLSKEVLDLQAAVEQGKAALNGYLGVLDKNGRDITEVKSKLDADQKLLGEVMKRREDLGREEGGGRETTEVETVEIPVISQIPCSPKITQNLVTGSVAGALFLPLLAGMMIPLMGRK